MRHLESSRICIIKENAGFMPAFSAEQLFCYIASEESTVSVSIKIPLVGTGVENTICVSVLPNLWSCPINEIHGIRKADLHEHGVRTGHTVAFQYIWTCFNKWIEGWLLFWIKSHVYKCCDVISESLMVDACVISGQYSCFLKSLYSC